MPMSSGLGLPARPAGGQTARVPVPCNNVRLSLFTIHTDGIGMVWDGN